MKWWIIALMGLAGLVAFATSADATTTCHATGNWCQGFAHVGTSTGVAGIRCFSLRITNSAPTCSASGVVPSNEATWEMAAGSCLTFYYFENTNGASPPLAANKITINVKMDNTATVARTYQTEAAAPASGTSYSFCATSDGTSTGSVRAGTYRLYVRAHKDDAVVGVNYDVDSDGIQNTGTIAGFDKGALRGQIIIGSITRSAYPTGSTFAYGSAGDESVTVTTTHTMPNVDAGLETAFNSVLDNAGLTVGQAGTTTDLDATSLAQAFIIDNTFPGANSPYVAGFTIAGNSALTSLKWTSIAGTGHGSCVTRVSDTFAYCSTTFNIDPGLKWSTANTASYAGANNLVLTKLGSSSGATVTVFNRGEVVYWESYMLNSRGELLSRAMTVTVHDSVPTVCNSLGSITPSSNKYSGTFTISTGATCLASNDVTGLLRTFTATNTDQSKKSGNSYFVSTYYYTDYHSQRTSVLVQDDWPTQNQGEHSAYVISADIMHVWCHVRGVRLDINIDTGVNDVTVKETETDDTTVIDSFMIGTGTDGWTTTADMVSPVPPARTIHGHCDVSFNGNTGSDTQSIGWSSAFTGDLNCRMSIEDWNPTIGVTTRVFLLTSQGGENITPDESPHIRVAYADNTSSPAVWVTTEPHESMLNVQDGTATVDGPLYYYDWTPSHVGLINLETHCQINGAALYQDKVIAVRPILMTAFTTLTGFTGSEFAAVIGLAIVGVILWIRSTDLGIRLFGAVLPMIAGALIIYLTVQEGISSLWTGSIATGAILIVAGIYLVIRLFLEDFLEKRAAGEA